MKYVFFGTPEFAEIILRELIEAGLPPVAVVCNPDRPVGRKRVITPPPTKIVAQKHKIKVYQPETKSELLELSDELGKVANFAVVAAYAKIVPQAVIDNFKLGIIGVHPSMLPKYRGASPIQSAILAGEQKTGTTLFMIEAGMDSGPILTQQEVEVNRKYYQALLRDLADTSAKVLIDTLPAFVKSSVLPQVQDDSQATYTKLFETADAKVDQGDLEKALSGDESQAWRIERMVRALNPEPGTFSIVDGKRIKFLRARVEGGKLVLEETQKEGKRPQRV
ncbi:MAG: methionyl-tRNA formyltransferase [bacterium]|nr:methionyl-tRNA formyltransferase [bacterium]